MPPKAVKVTLTTEHFLAACIKHAKEKVQVDFNALAADTGMSAGGASNKYRIIMKQLDEERAAAADADVGAAANPTAPPQTPKPPKTPGKRKIKTDDAAADDDGEATPAKKPRATRAPRSAKKTAAQKIKEEQDAEDADVSNVGAGADEGVDAANAENGAEDVKGEAA